MSTSIADYFRSQAAWRLRIAEQYPDDPRNVQSADALDSLADFVAPDEAGQCKAGSVLDRLAPFVWEGPTLGGEQVARATSRYGYGYAVGLSSHEEFLEELAALCVSDAYEFARDSGDDPTGELLPFELDAARDHVFLPERYFERRAGSTETELGEAIEEYRGDA